MSGCHPFFQYTQEVLSWRLGAPATGPRADAPSPTETARRADRILRHCGNRRGVVLAGLGSGQLAAALADALPPDVALTVVSADPESARERLQSGALPWWRPDGSRQLLADTSALALFSLLVRQGGTPATSLVTVNPETASGEERQRLRLWQRLFTATRPISEPLATAPASPRPTLAVLARPDEPDLTDFFTALRGLVDRAVVLWDAPAAPGQADRIAALLGSPVKHLARPLAADFAAQRNTLLAACPENGWVLSLDPDERPGPNLADAIARVMALPDVAGAAFPRLTLHPRHDHFLVGYGLWPDQQVRLFRRHGQNAPHYVRPVHERLENLPGPLVLALDAPLLHLNRRLADDATVRAKLARFDTAAGAAIHHQLSPDYPSLPETFFRSPPDLPPGGRLLLPPPLW